RQGLVYETTSPHRKITIKAPQIIMHWTHPLTKNPQLTLGAFSCNPPIISSPRDRSPFLRGWSRRRRGRGRYLDVANGAGAGFKLMTFRLHGLLDLFGDALLPADGGVLAGVDTRFFDSLFQLHVVFQDVEDGLVDGVDNGRTTGGADGEDRLAVF